MGVFSGPRTPSTEGLVFALDAANSKSFRGVETTNELLDITWIGDGGGTGTLVTDNNLRYNGYPTYYYTPGTSLNSYLNGADVDAARTSTVWTFSCYVKREDGAPITSLNVYMYYPSSDGFAAGIIQDAGNGWYRVSRTRTGTSSNISLCGFTGFASGIKYYLSGAQLEKKLNPSTYVLTNTTRGSTIAAGGGWQDLSGYENNGSILNGIEQSFANGGSLIFDGIDDYVSISNSTSLQITQNISLTCWLKTNWNVNFNAILDDLGATPFASWGLWITSNGKIGWYDNGGAVWRESATSVNTNLPVNICSVLNGTTVRFYINGVLDANSYTVPALVSNSDAKAIGRRADGGGFNFRGNLYYCSIYNRALNSNEVVRNFNSMRGRFGI